MGARWRAGWAVGVLAAAAFALSACDTPAERCEQAWIKEAFLKPDDFFELCREGCDQGQNAEVCQIVGWCYRDGDCRGGPTAPDYGRALEYARRSCELGEAQVALGKLEATSSSFARRDELWRTECLVDPGVCEARCGKDDAEACGWLAGMYWRGRGQVKADSWKAMSLYRQACDLGYGCLADGFAAACDSHDPDVCIARCEQGDANACYWTAAMFREGLRSAHVLRDGDRARRQLELACKFDEKISRRCATLGQAEAPEPAVK
jgi:TPR repeat protein